jgi:hypothetical protein
MKRGGLVLYQGPSLFDGAPIVVIVTFVTTNQKTGDVLQTWILRQDVAPNEALREGLDVSVCGTCRHRGQGGRGRTCYVIPYQAPLMIWRTWKAGGYPEFSGTAPFEGRVLRVGSYGDPCAVPMEAWLPALGASQAHVGYTHAWRTADPAWRHFVMASVESEAEAREAWELGWRTFRATLPEALPVARQEITCPSERGVHCEKCRLCAGTSKPSARSIAIPVHGYAARTAVVHGVVT